MFPDELDIFVISQIYDAYLKKKDSDSWIISKNYAKSIIKNPTERQIENIYFKVKSRLKSYCIKGIFCATENGDGKTIFEMNLDKITFVKKKFTDGYKKCLVIRIE